MSNTYPLPLRVLNHLRQGREVAAEVEPSDRNARAWVFITPVPGVLSTLFNPGSERIDWRKYPDTARLQIEHYWILRLEVLAEALERLRDDDLRDGEANVEKIVVQGEADVGPVIIQWVSDFEALRDPGNVQDATLAHDRVCAYFGLHYAT
jgi:hypothetical protein